MNPVTKPSILVNPVSYANAVAVTNSRDPNLCIRYIENHKNSRYRNECKDEHTTLTMNVILIIPDRFLSASVHFFILSYLAKIKINSSQTKLNK